MSEDAFVMTLDDIYELLQKGECALSNGDRVCRVKTSVGERLADDAAALQSMGVSSATLDITLRFAPRDGELTPPVTARQTMDPHFIWTQTRRVARDEQGALTSLPGTINLLLWTTEFGMGITDGKPDTTPTPAP